MDTETAIEDLQPAANSITDWSRDGNGTLNNQDNALDLLATIRDLANRTQRIMEAAETSGDQKTALAAIREARSTYETIARLSGGTGKQSSRAISCNLLQSGEWQSVRTLILEALEEHDEARLAVAHALSKLGGTNAKA